ncbi:MAG: nucleotidyltransferase domain-containing protein [Micrococcales bacterium]|nr:nucleotidyltransferase domain-containing protein [Micrococcales bacterium]MCL2668247.1 nucleotidyltransferase domain-containing protein [Micrococcales bacterium]
MDDDLRERRLAAGMTQEDVARYAGVAAPNVAAYEAGKRPMSPAMRERLVRAMRRPSAALAEHADEVKDRLAQAHAVNVRVFGSVARGEDTPGSDVDLLFDVEEGASAFEIGAVQEDIAELLGFHVDLVSSRAVPERKRQILDEAVPL